MELVILIVSIITLTVSIVICIIAVNLSKKSKVDYSDVVTDALEKRISTMEHNLTDVENGGRSGHGVSSGHGIHRNRTRGSAAFARHSMRP